MHTFDFFKVIDELKHPKLSFEQLRSNITNDKILYAEWLITNELVKHALIEQLDNSNISYNIVDNFYSNMRKKRDVLNLFNQVENVNDNFTKLRAENLTTKYYSVDQVKINWILILNLVCLFLFGFKIRYMNGWSMFNQLIQMLSS